VALGRGRKSARRVAPRPAPSPISRQSRKESPVVANSNRPTKAAAAIEIAAPQCRARIVPKVAAAPSEGAAGPRVERGLRDRELKRERPNTRIKGSSAIGPGRANWAVQQQAKGPSEEQNRDQERCEPELCHSRSASTAPS